MAALDSHPFALPACHLAKVVSVADPQNLARVQIRLLTVDGDGAADIWARVAVPFAGAGRGALFIPDVDDEVLVTFLAGDTRYPIVIGGLWNGGATPPEQFGGDRVDRWTITGKAGTRIAIVEATDGSAKIEFKTPNGVSGTLTDEAGGSITFEDTSGTSLTIDAQGISLQTPAKVKIQASQVEVSAGMVKVDAGMSTFSGVVKCDVLQASTVISATYTPGAGNIW
jgi:uncharacterized protein involved in type VI secretion and phage assembly